MCFKVVIRHINCWSEVFSDFPNVMGELISQNVNKDRVTGTVAIYTLGDRIAILDNFLKGLKKESSIISVDNVISVSNGRVKLVKITATRQDSMSNFMYSNNILLFKEFFLKGLEIWYFAGTDMTLSMIKNSISEIAEIYSVEKISEASSFNIFSNFGNRMKSSQENLLTFLYENRYFEMKDRKNLQQLSSVLHTSKSNLSRKVRIIEKNLAEEYIAKIKSIQVPDFVIHSKA